MRQGQLMTEGDEFGLLGSGRDLVTCNIRYFLISYRKLKEGALDYAYTDHIQDVPGGRRAGDAWIKFCNCSG